MNPTGEGEDQQVFNLSNQQLRKIGLSPARSRRDPTTGQSADVLTAVSVVLFSFSGSPHEQTPLA